MGNGMNKILPGLYVGNFRDARDAQALQENGITHVLAIHDNAKQLHQDKIYLCIGASDVSTQDLLQYFSQCIDFIHEARLNGGSVLVHCLAGMSRSVTVTVAYIMTVTDLPWRDALHAVRRARSVANPNYGFQKQLQIFEHDNLKDEKKRFLEKYADNPFEESDKKECDALVAAHQRWVYGEEMYPLPHNAFGQHYTPNTTSQSNTKSGNPADPTNSASTDNNAQTDANNPSTSVNSSGNNNNGNHRASLFMDKDAMLTAYMHAVQASNNSQSQPISHTQTNMVSEITSLDDTDQ